MFTFLALNFCLFVLTFITGYAPLLINFSPARLRVVSVFGAGLLLGAVLMIVIPEGIEAVYDAARPVHLESHEVANAAASLPLDVQSPSSSSPSTALFGQLHEQVGLALLFGYLAMLLVDQLLSASDCSKSSLTRRLLCCRPTLSSRHASTRLGELGESLLPGSVSGDVGAVSSSKSALTATVGLALHSLADGAALGAAFALGQLQLKIVLFMAILLHKIPAGFGLVAYLLSNGLDKARIRLHLLVFSIASPLAALLTLIMLTTVAQSTDAQASAHRTGMALLVSGGTFLYVAASHILPELVLSTSSKCQSSSQSASDQQHHGVFNCLQTVVLLVGALIPVVVSSVSHHHH